MIFKFSEVMLLIVLKLVEIFIEVGLFDGVFNVLFGDGVGVGLVLIEYFGIEKIFFIGGISIGCKVMVSVFSFMFKEVMMEFGGKLLLIVCVDVDLDLVVDVVMMVNFYSVGQVCINGICVFVFRICFVVFEGKLLDCVVCICIGDLLVSDIIFGLFVSVVYMYCVFEYIVSGRVEGVWLVCGGECFIDGVLVKGCYVVLIIFSDCCDDMCIVCEEIFGLVMSLLVYDDEEEVVCCVNDIDYGLVVGVVIFDFVCVYCFIYQFEVGICWINCWGELLVQMLVGGYKQFGVGCENGLVMLCVYICIKFIQIELDCYVLVF